MFDQIQTKGPGSKNPLRRWLAAQPLTVTQTTMARELGIARNTMSELMSDENPKLPSLRLAVRIEKMTNGAVIAADLVSFAASAKEAA